MKGLQFLVAGAMFGAVVFNSKLLAQSILPKPDPIFTGKMEPDSRRSIEDWPGGVKAPKGAPNVLLILVDDVGFSATSTLGGEIQTPAFENLAKSGLLYNNFHVNAICSPSRASLLSGRTDHQMGFGSIAEFAAGYPGYDTLWPRKSASIAEVLKDNGYNTAAFGKWHNTPVWQISPTGPFDRWPTGLGFQYFYGFMSGSDNEYYPRLYRDTLPVQPPKTPEQGYYLTTDITNDAIRWLHQHDAVAPNTPFFIYFAPGATHAPDQVPKQWIERYKGKFDEGWDKLREETYERQNELGVISANAELTPRPEGLPPWNSLPADERELLARQAEVYAGYTTQVDFEIGRLIQAVKADGHGDNTLIIEIFGDNGGSAEAGPTGYDVRTVYGQSKSIKDRLKYSQYLGSPLSMNAAAAAWAWAFSTPFKGTKGDASHLGGTTDPLVISWPTGIKQDGGLRNQFSHETDIAPTIYEAAGIRPPIRVNGVWQSPLYGTSLLYTFDHPHATSRHHIQVLETNGNRSIYKDGWWAGDLLRPAWDWVGSPGYTATELLNGHLHPWELYNLTDDYSQAHDLAAKYPKKLAAMKVLFDQQARQTNIYPFLPLRLYNDRPGLQENVYVYRSGVDRLQDTANPPLGGGIPYTINADIEVPEHAITTGVIFAQGGRYGGSSLFVKNGRVFYEVNAFGNDAGQLVSSNELKPGRDHIVVLMEPDPARVTNGTRSAIHSQDNAYTGKMTINGVAQGDAHFVNVPRTGGYWADAETLDIGCDLGSAVSSEYQAPDYFTGIINKVTIHVRTDSQ